MMMRIAVLLATFAASVGWAQPPVAWWENPVANGLTLNDSQRDRINAIVRDHRDRLAAARQEVDRVESELEGVFNAEAIDWARARNVTDQLVKVRGDLTREFIRMTLRLRNVLTGEQWRTLQSRTNNGKDVRGRGRPGPPSRP